MKTLHTLLMGLFVLLIVSACQTPQAETEELDMDAIRAEIQAMEDAYAVAANAKDAEAEVAYYADDANSLTPNKPTLVGKAAILANTKEQMAKDTTEGGSIRFEIVDLYASGDLVVEVGKSISTDADNNETTGKYVSIFEKRDGKYICIRDIYNRDQKDDDNDDDDGDDD